MVFPVKHLSSAISMVHSDLFIFYNELTHYYEGVLNQNSLVNRKLNGKNRLPEGHPRFLSNFPFVNL